VTDSSVDASIDASVDASVRAAIEMRSVSLDNPRQAGKIPFAFAKRWRR
jgi:hypothetical protein